MGNVIPARGQVTEKLNAIIAGVQWIEKEKVSPNFIPINLQNMKYLAAGVRGCFLRLDYRDPRGPGSGGSNTADIVDTCSRGFVITIGWTGVRGGALHRCIRHSTDECWDPDSFGNVALHK